MDTQIELAKADFSEDIRLVEGIKAVPAMLDVVCQATGMGFAAVARVTRDRWVACSVRDDIDFGLKPGDELQIETTICHEIREHHEVVVIDDVATDPVYKNHHTPALYGLRSYISVPIILGDGTFFGTLCAIDSRPAQVSRPHIVGMFKLFADMIGHHAEAWQSVVASHTALRDEREASALREQFIAVLGHDLRNPLAGIAAGARILGKENLSPRGVEILGLVNQTVGRMSGLIDNVMDFARGRLGGGITLNRTARPIAPILTQVVAELQTGHPDREIVTDFAVDGPVDCDPVRIGQLFSNLLSNAMAHSAPGSPVRASAAIVGDCLELRTVNHGKPIPPEARARLFAPFARSEKQGLGLGLYIAAQIAKAHHGTLEVGSAGEDTVFTFRMPLR